MTSRKKTGAAFWATVGLAVVLAYPLSFGPACWLASRHRISHELFNRIYWRLGWATQRKFSMPAFDALYAYGSLWLPKDGALAWDYDRDRTGSSSVILIGE